MITRLPEPLRMPAIYATPAVVFLALPKAIEIIAQTSLARRLHSELRGVLNMQEGEPFPITERARPIYRILANNAWGAVLLQQAFMRTPLLTMQPAHMRFAFIMICIFSVKLQLAREIVMDYFPSLDRPDRRVLSRSDV